MSETTDAPVGRRERKKAATRQALAAAALRLFLERGYDRVSIKDIADAADVSTTTLFKHFNSKEELVFDRADEQEARLVAVVRDRPAGQTVLEALRRNALQVLARADVRESPLMHLVDKTPALKDAMDRMTMRHETALATAVAAAVGVAADDRYCAALTRFALQARLLARDNDDPIATVDAAFALLEHGWTGGGSPSGR